jgi:hypothetical protein
MEDKGEKMRPLAARLRLGANTHRRRPQEEDRVQDGMLRTDIEEPGVTGAGQFNTPHWHNQSTEGPYSDPDDNSGYVDTRRRNLKIHRPRVRDSSLPDLLAFNPDNLRSCRSQPP